jgi:hypothetical protein
MQEIIDDDRVDFDPDEAKVPTLNGFSLHYAGVH